MPKKPLCTSSVQCQADKMHHSGRKVGAMFPLNEWINFLSITKYLLRISIATINMSSLEELQIWLKQLSPLGRLKWIGRDLRWDVQLSSRQNLGLLRHWMVARRVGEAMWRRIITARSPVTVVFSVDILTIHQLGGLGGIAVCITVGADCRRISQRRLGFGLSIFVTEITTSGHN